MAILENVTKEHYNTWVVTDGFESKKIVAFDKDLGKALTQARNNGAKDPVILFVYPPSTTLILLVA